MPKVTALLPLPTDRPQASRPLPAIAATVGEPRAALATSVDDVLQRLARWSADFAAGSASATLKAVRFEWTQYLRWCERRDATPLPASIAQLEAFLRTAIDNGRKRATVDRYVYTVGLARLAAGLPSPTKGRDWPVTRKMKAAGLDNADTISGHSARIGSANDPAEYGATSTQIQQAGGWKTERMVAYYTRKSTAGTGAMDALRRAADRPRDAGLDDSNGSA